MILLKTSPLPSLTQVEGSGLPEWPPAVGVHTQILQAEARAIQDEADEDVLSARVVGLGAVSSATNPG